MPDYELIDDYMYRINNEFEMALDSDSDDFHINKCMLVEVMTCLNNLLELGVVDYRVNEMRSQIVNFLPWLQ